MVPAAADLITEFVEFVKTSDTAFTDFAIQHELLPAPHRPCGLPVGKCAVYVFSLSHSAGRACDAGPNRILKVGNVGPKSNARFLSQHYNPNSSRSNLAKSILNQTNQWRFLGIQQVDHATVGDWIKDNTDRDHFFLDAGQKMLLVKLEKFIRGRLGGSVFEG